MAIKDRTELNTAVDTLLVATVDIASKHSPLLKDNIIESAVLRKDEILSDTATTTSYTANFTDYDLIQLDCSGYNIALSVTNLNAGEVKHLILTGTGTITSISGFQIHQPGTLINNSSTLSKWPAVFQLSNKNGNLSITCLNRDMGLFVQNSGTFDFVSFINEYWFDNYDKNFEVECRINSAVTINNGPTFAISGNKNFRISGKVIETGDSILEVIQLDDTNPGVTARYVRYIGKTINFPWTDILWATEEDISLS